MLIDDCFATVGSQNFTKRGRKNKECTSLPSVPLFSSPFAATLIEWRTSGKPIELDYINSLIDLLEPLLREQEILTEKTTEVINQCKSEWEQSKKQNSKFTHHSHEDDDQADEIQLEKMALESQIQLEHGEALLEVKSHLEPYSQKPYARLDRYSDGNLTDWVGLDSDNSRTRISLTRLGFYPAYLSDTKRFAFVRIGKTGITYFRDTVRRNGLKFDDFTCDGTVSFPETGCRRRNIILTLNIHGHGSCKIEIHYSPRGTTVVNVGPDWHNQIPNESIVLRFSSIDVIEHLLEQAFKPFTYESLGIKDKNLPDYLKDPYYRMTIIQIRSAPILHVAINS